jgi:hypothetical protein
MTSTHREPRPHRYEILVRGRPSAEISSAFPALRAETRDGDTVLTGELADQAALHGVIAEVKALGLILLEVRRRPSQHPDTLEQPS